MRQLTVPAPAKLNLFLHITGRRADGYHELQTLFQLLDYGDSLHFRLREDGQLHLNSRRIDLDPADNLVLKAATTLQQHTGTKLGADIVLEKRLPLGGGLGGGSSDAASTLLALNQLWQTGLDLPRLAELGLQLGADVPVFVHGRSAWAEGVGERLQPLELPQRHYLVVVPPVAVSTARVFSDEQLTRSTSPIKIAAFLERGGHNDCEPVVRRLYPAVDDALNWLARCGDARLTGTGGCVFAEFAERSAAEQRLSELPANLQGFVAGGVNHSPAHRILGIVAGR